MAISRGGRIQSQSLSVIATLGRRVRYRRLGAVDNCVVFRCSCAQIILVWRMLGWQLGVPAGFRHSPRDPGRDG
jgi:hypothetical protein